MAVKNLNNSKTDLLYNVYVYFKFDPLQKKQFYVISIATEKLFTNLNYEISVNVVKKKGEIDIKILGLNALQSYIVQPKPARSDLYFEELLGAYKINIIKQDGSINSAKFYFNIFKKEILLLEENISSKKSSKIFSKFFIDNSAFTFKEDK